MSAPQKAEDEATLESGRAAFVARALAEAPPLRPEQRAQLAELLKPVRIHRHGG